MNLKKKNNAIDGIVEEINVGRYVPKVVEIRSSGTSMGGIIHANPLYIVKDTRSIYKPLARLFEEIGIRVAVVDKVPENAFSVLYLKGLDTYEKDSYHEHLKVCEAGFLCAKICAKNLYEDKAKMGLFVTIQDTGGDFGIHSRIESGVWGAGLSGLVKTASQEWENASVKAIDIDCDEKNSQDIAKAIFDEIIYGGPEIEVGITKDEKRNIVVTEAVPDVAANFWFNDGDVILVSGGARGITANCILELTLERKLKIAIFGRNELVDEPSFTVPRETEAELKKVFLVKLKEQGKTITPVQLSREVNKILACREIRNNLKQIKENGSEVKYFNIDINHFEELQTAVTEIRSEWGEIKGIIHGAGVLADKPINEQTEEQFKRVFNTKVIGFYNLLESTAKDNLTHICCFSSVAARYGNKGQVAYSMANEVLNKVSKKRYSQSGGKCLVKSINWGPWDGGMVTPLLKSYFVSNGISLLPVKQGAKRFVEELTNIGSNVEVIIGSPITKVKEKSAQRKWLLCIHKDTHPSIESHIIKGTPVVPAVLINEICLKLAKTAYPEENFNCCRNFKVLKGITLKDYYGRGDWFYIQCEEENEGVKKLVFKVGSIKGVPHYSMEILSNQTPQISTYRKDTQSEGQGWKLTDIYNQHLFHGRYFQVIQRLSWFDGNQCAAVLYKDKPADMKDNEYGFNTAIIDGGLQLALLWARNQYEIKTLPTGYKELIMIDKINFGEKITCIFEALESNQTFSRFNITFLGLNRDVLAQIKDVSMFAYND